jgi:homogentisate 1,2-dioxygenase
MPFYQRLGNIPEKRHVVFRQPSGELYHEQLFGTIGFTGMSSLLYHVHRPTMVKEVREGKDLRPIAAVDRNLLSRKLKGFDVQPSASYLDGRVPVLFNSDCTLILVAPTASMAEDEFYKNADCDEVVFVHKGKGILHSMLGQIAFGPGDYLVIPRGMIHRFSFESSENRFFITESAHPVYTPKRYRNHFGQLLEHSPFCERDMRTPQNLETIDEKGAFTIRIKKEGFLHEFEYASHPFDVVGWDGYNYPYAFNIRDFEPITGRVHQPPPVHQTFETDAFVMCSFVPRMYDYHPDAIPAPYNHSNIDSDEVLYYVAGNFMSRTDVDAGDITLHPAGIPHGPHPGTYEDSIGKKDTAELAVMVDTFRPLKLTQQALDLERPDYHTSWID